MEIIGGHMKIEKLLELLNTRIGFVESKYRDEVIKGARIAFDILSEERQENLRPLDEAEKETERLRIQLCNIAAIIKEHGDFN